MTDMNWCAKCEKQSTIRYYFFPVRFLLSLARSRPICDRKVDEDEHHRCSIDGVTSRELVFWYEWCERIVILY